MTDASPRAIVLRAMEFYNDHSPEVYTDTEKFLAMLSEDCVQEFAPTQQAPARRLVGKQSARENIEAVAAALRASHIEVHEAIAEGERVVLRYTWTGIVRPDATGLTPGTRLRADGTGFYTVRDGLIVEMVDVMGPILPAEPETAEAP